MANRYWVGGSGTWNTTSTTNWSTTSGGPPGATAPTLAADVAIFDLNSAGGTGSFTVTLASAVCLTLTVNNPVAGGSTLTFAGTGLQIGTTGISTVGASVGSVVFSNTLIDLGFSFTVSTANTVFLNCTTLNVRNSGANVNLNTNACSASCNVTIDNSGGSTTLGSNFTTTGSFSVGTVNSGTTFTITGRTLSCGSFVSNGTVAFGTTGIVNLTGTGTTVFNITGSGGAFTGTTNFNLTTNASSGSRTISMSSVATAIANFNVTAGTDSIIITTNVNIGNLNFTGFSGTLDATAALSKLNGNLTLSSTMTVPDAATAVTFVSISGSQTVTSNGVGLNRAITVNNGGSGIFVVLADDFSTTRAFLLTAGGLNINGKNLTALTFSASNANNRTLAWGTGGKVIVTGSGTAYTQNNVLNLVVTGSGTVVSSYNGATAVTIDSSVSPTAAQRFNLQTTGAGTFNLVLSPSGCAFNDVNLANHNGTVGANPVTIYGSLTLSSAAGFALTASANTISFGATSGTKTITTNGKLIDRPVTFDGAGGTWQLQDAMTVGSTRLFTHTNGTLDLNGKTLTLLSYTTAAGTKVLNFNAGTMTLTGSLNNAVPTGFTSGGTNGFIVMTSSSAKSFTGGSRTYAATLVQAGSGTLTISGSNAFGGGLKNTVQPCTISLTSSTNNTFTGDIKLKGTGGSLVTLNAVTAGTAATLTHTGSDVSCDYISVKDNTASGTVPFYAGAHSTLVSNTTNWSLRPPPSANTEFMPFLQ